MSIALDLALFLREQKTLKPLTLTERGLLFTLFFRVGSNPNTWVSQETLAMELDIVERNVRRLLSSIQKKGYIETQQKYSDKRKNEYRPAEFLINYHQQINRLPTKKYRSKLSSISKNTGQNYPVNTGQNYPLSNNAKTVETLIDTTLNKIATSPKGKVESNTIKEKSTARKNRVPLPDDFVFDEKRKIQLKEVSEKCNTTPQDLIDTFRDVAKAEGKEKVDWNAELSLFLRRQRPVYKENTKKINKSDEQTRCTVPWFNPDHANVG